MARSVAKAILEKQIALRRKFWPTVEDTDLWLRNERQGFATVPRTLPMICCIMDDLSKGKPLSSTYLSLWCHVLDEMFLEIQSPAGMAFASGFDGERAVRTWRDRMSILKELGFICSKDGVNGEFSYVLLLNPYHVIRRLKANGIAGLTERRFNELEARAHYIGASDMDESLPDDPINRKM